MRKMPLIILCAGMAIAPIFSTAAEPATATDEQLEKMVYLLRIPQLHIKSVEQTKRMQSKMFAGSTTQSGMTKGTEDYQRNIMRKIEDELSWKKRKQEYMDVVARTFTPQEIREIVAFYDTPWGRSLLLKELQAQKQIGAAMNRKTNAMIPKLDERNRRFLKVKEIKRKVGINE